VQDAGTTHSDDAPMTKPTPIAVGRTARNPLARMRALATAWLRTRWPHVLLDHELGYLGNATDLADLERRMRALERCGVRPPC
jgi:Protein of unknown function (DUF3563)